ncbi:MAG: PVC-type heme-binding CxxCH protein [Verrucomicrobiales bacterium]
MISRFRFSIFLALLLLAAVFQPAVAEDKPHAVFVVGTPHYNPAASMPPLAEQLEETFGWETTVLSTDYNPEKDSRGIPGLEALETADLAVFYLRFLTLPPEQFAHLEAYLKSGKPVVALRTSSHAFAYPEDSPLAEWNDAFGKRAMGTKYFIHGEGITWVSKAAEHEILTGVDLDLAREASGTLYLSELPDEATVLLEGTGAFRRTGTVTNAFGTHELEAEMTDDVAWIWTNEWGGRVFGTTLGHPTTLSDPNWVRLLINGMHWAAGQPVPDADAKVEPIEADPEDTQYAVPVPTPEPEKKKIPASKRQTGAKADAGMPPIDDRRNPRVKNEKDAKWKVADKPEPERDPALADHGIYAENAPTPERTAPVATALPLKLEKGDRIAFIGNTLFDRAQNFGWFESSLYLAHPEHDLVIRNFAWSADEIDLQPRPDNFATVKQHLTREKIDVVFAAFGYNESFDGIEAIDSFKARLATWLIDLKTSAFNGESGPRLVLVSPIANENVEGVPAADLNNERLAAYTKAMAEVAAEQEVGFADVFETTRAAMADDESSLTFNGAHLVEEGYERLAGHLFSEVFGTSAPDPNAALREVVVDKNRQFFRRYRPLNTFYYTGGRSKDHGYLDFLPAMRNFDIMTANREKRAWEIVRSQSAGVDSPGDASPGDASAIDDSNVPPLDDVVESMGANEWLSPADELAAFRVDPRFEVNLFASEEEFPDIANPIQMRWDAQGRLWVSCSTTYPHVYPGQEPNDKIVILEDTAGDGKADKSTVWADDVHIPLSFELYQDGIYVSEEPHLSLLRDTDGDGKADWRRHVSTGFGTEDSHHALHDFVWTPDGELLFRESIFHNSQVETPYGPVRAKNSAWFQFRPVTQKLVTFGAYPNTNPWGVTFDDWGNHVASHPIFASAFHATNPPYPEQHPKAVGIPAYSGVCGHEFVDFPSWPEEMQGGFVKARYKPTNSIEFHRWVEKDDHFAEEYVGDLIFSENLSFIPVDVKYGPRGAMYICDWYNPVKGHAQYSLRDPRRDRESGRIWRIVPKGAELSDPPRIADAAVPELLDNLKRREYRYRYWTRRELRDAYSAEAVAVAAATDQWLADLDPDDERYRHHQVEAMWLYRSLGESRPDLLAELLECDQHLARAAVTRLLRYPAGDTGRTLWQEGLADNGLSLDRNLAFLEDRANDENGLVRLEAVVAASYVGTREALEAIVGVFDHPVGTHLGYAVTTALGSEALAKHWKDDPDFQRDHPRLTEFMKVKPDAGRITIAKPTPSERKFDRQKNLEEVEIRCVPERLLFDVTRIEVVAGQPVKIVLFNPDATQHNLVVVEPGALEEVGLAGNEMAKDPGGLAKGFIPDSPKILHHTALLEPDTAEALRFHAPKTPGTYPYLCTFPGHWFVMKGEMIVE